MPAKDPFCPLYKCGVDGASHILAGCQDKQMKGFYHNRAVCIIQKAVSKDANGNNYMVMDSGKQDELPDTVHNQRMPESLRPTYLVTAEQWRTFRPDLVLITGMLANETPTHTRHEAAHGDGGGWILLRYQP